MQEPTLKPKILTLKEMWEVYKLWKSPSPSGVSKMLRIIFPSEDFTKYSPGEIVQLAVYGLYGVGVVEFENFLKSVTNGNSAK